MKFSIKKSLIFPHIFPQTCTIIISILIIIFNLSLIYKIEFKYCKEYLHYANVLKNNLNIAKNVYANLLRNK